MWKACRDDEHGRIVRLLALTGCRRDEIGGLRWSEIDMQERALTLPSERVKNGHAHRLPLSDAMIEIIKGTPHRLYCPTLFGGHRSNASGRGFTDWSQGKRDLDGRIGKEVAPWRLHDLRRSLATGMADIGVQPHIIEEILIVDPDTSAAWPASTTAAPTNRRCVRRWRSGRSTSPRSSRGRVFGKSVQNTHDACWQCVDF